MDNKPKHTNYLGDKKFDKPKMKPRMTGPLDDVIPWVIEFRVVGTPSLIKVQVSDEMLIGRPDPNNGINPEIDVIPYGGRNLGVSRKHALIRTINNRITIQDLDSANGTYINEHILESNKEYRIRDRDIIRLGHMRLQVHFIVKPLMIDETNVNLREQMQIPKLGSGERIMVVDDDRNVTEVISLILKHAGFKVTVKHGVAEAMAEIDHKLPHGIITELVLPDMSGLDVIRYAHQKSPELPIMVISTATGGFQMGQAIDEGIELFMAKPVAIDGLIRGIGKMQSDMRPV
jgi:CheY-like chemotaxis protein